MKNYICEKEINGKENGNNILDAIVYPKYIQLASQFEKLKISMYILSILALVLYQHYTAGKYSSTSLKIPILFSHFIYFLIFFLIV